MTQDVFEDDDGSARQHLARFAIAFLREGWAEGIDRRQWSVTIPMPDGTSRSISLEEAAGGPEVVSALMS